MFIPNEGKGGLIIIFLFISAVLTGISYRVFGDFFNMDKNVHPGVLLGIMLIITGMLTRWTANDYYTNREGQKKPIEFFDSLFFIKMKTWGKYLPFIGIAAIVYGIVSE